MSTETHPDDVAVDLFARNMKEKLAQARAKGRGGWQTCGKQKLSDMLHDHVAKGDPRDVANFCMFLHLLGHSIQIAPTKRTAPAPSASPAAQWEDPRVQQVYEILCRNDAPPPGEHWEGFQARLIIDVLCGASPAALTDAELAVYLELGAPPSLRNVTLADLRIVLEYFAALPAALTDEALIDAANTRADLYEGDVRPDIKTDVINAFYAGAEFAKRAMSASKVTP